MAGEGSTPEKPDDEPDYKKWAVVLGAFSAIFAILAAINTLTGFNPLKDIMPPASSTSHSPPTSSLRVSEAEAPRRTTSATEEADKSTKTSTETTESSETTKTTPPSQPDFRVRSSQWDGPCGDSWCSMSAVFLNAGGAGAGSATFYILLPDRDNYLAKCSVVLRSAAENDRTSAGCTASSVQLQTYFGSHRGGTVRMQVKVDG
ncbi:hypothetical protein [Amycolatopsis sp. NPDC051071]|uniref:hypothetical protein n=1 Tax=Amycolatopsis sp. NPDC051071 TaxID=3154637 RepID=UPI003440309F